MTTHRGYGTMGSSVLLDHGHTRASRAVVGASLPTDIYEKQRQTEAKVNELDAYIRTYVTRQEFKDAWEEWKSRWKAFYGKYGGANDLLSWTRVAALLHLEEIDAQTEDYRKQLAAWQDAYTRERDGRGQPLPTPIEPTPGPIVPPPPPPKAGWSMPAWAWILLGLGIAGAGYATYVYVRQAQASKRRLEKALPDILAAYAGPAGRKIGEAAQTSGDPGGAPRAMIQPLVLPPDLAASEG